MRGTRNILAGLILAAALAGCVFDAGYGHRSNGGYYGEYSSNHNGGYGWGYGGGYGGGYGNGYHHQYYNR